MYRGFTEICLEGERGRIELKIAEVTTYGYIDGLLRPQRSIGGHHRMKKLDAKGSCGIMTKCGDTEALDGPS